MTRLWLGALLTGGVLSIALATAWMACVNHARARELDRLQRACEELQAVRARLRTRVDAHVPGVATPPIEGLDDELISTTPVSAWTVISREVDQ